MQKDDKKEYDLQKRNQAYTAMGLRVLVAGYLIYLAWNIFSGSVLEGSEIKPWIATLIALVFTAVAVWFIRYAWKGFKQAMRLAVINDNQETAEISDGGQGDMQEIEPHDIEGGPYEVEDGLDDAGGDLDEDSLAEIGLDDGGFEDMDSSLDTGSKPEMGA